MSKFAKIYTIMNYDKAARNAKTAMPEIFVTLRLADTYYAAAMAENKTFVQRIGRDKGESMECRYHLHTSECQRDDSDSSIESCLSMDDVDLLTQDKLSKTQHIEQPILSAVELQHRHTRAVERLGHSAFLAIDTNRIKRM